jgi:hypothetical protein
MGSREVFDVAPVMDSLNLLPTSWKLNFTPGFSPSFGGVGVATGTVDVTDPDGTTTSLRFVASTATAKDLKLNLANFELSTDDVPAFAFGKIFSNKAGLQLVDFEHSLLVITDNPAEGNGRAAVMFVRSAVDRVVAAVVKAIQTDITTGFNALFEAAESVAFLNTKDVAIGAASLISGSVLAFV